MKVKALTNDYDFTAGNVYTVIEIDDGPTHRIVYVKDDVGDFMALWPDEYEIVED